MVADEENMLTSMVSTETSGESDDEDLNDFFYQAGRDPMFDWKHQQVKVVDLHVKTLWSQFHAGPTAYASSRSNSTDELLKLFLTMLILEMILKMSNKEGMKILKDRGNKKQWLNSKHSPDFCTLLVLYRSSRKATEELW